MCSDWLKCVCSFARAARLQTGSDGHTWRGSVLISSPHRSRAEGVWGRLLQSAGGCRSDNELFGEAQNPRFHIADSQTRRESSTRSRGVVEKRSKRDETQNRNLCKHKEKDKHCRQTSGVFFLFSLSQQLSQFLWFGSKASWQAEHKGLRCCGWESSEVHRGCSPDSSTVNKFLTGLPLARMRCCRFPAISFPSIPHPFSITRITLWVSVLRARSEEDSSCQLRWLPRVCLFAPVLARSPVTSHASYLTALEGGAVVIGAIRHAVQHLAEPSGWPARDTCSFLTYCTGKC